MSITSVSSRILREFSGAIAMDLFLVSFIKKGVIEVGFQLLLVCFGVFGWLVF